MEPAAACCVEQANNLRRGEFAMAEASTKFSKSPAATVESLQDDLVAVRNDLSKLSEQLVGLLSAKGTAAYKRAKKQFGATVGDAADSAREVRDTLSDALEESVQERPLATLAMAIGVGFVLGAMWRR
jgi:ElaB/YqjD/DUF883 family membrane-anchored ribosome-binding protein